MSVFRDITITWGGVEYVATPTMRMLRQIEGNGVSLTDVSHRTAKGQPPVSHMSYIIATLLNDAGCNATEADVYATLINGSAKQSIELVNVVLEAFAPSSGDPGKKPAVRPASGGRKRRTQTPRT